MFEHTTVLLEEAVEGLAVKEGGVYVDCTLGGAGHTRLIAQKLAGSGHVYAFDQDDAALRNAEQVLSRFSNVTMVRSNFRHLHEELTSRGVKQVDGVLYDLGVSSPQFDTPERGFSYRFDTPLDMRMDQSQPLSAKEVVNEWSFEQLVRIFYTYGEEKFSKQIARAIERSRASKSIETTGELVELIKEAIPAPARRTGGHPAKRVFQAIRIAVNDELGAFEESLEAARFLLAPAGRLSVITFHSLEDRLCKQLIKQWSTPRELPKGLPVLPDDARFQASMKLVTRKPILPTEEEESENRRARSAKLRVAERTTAPLDKTNR